MRRSGTKLRTDGGTEASTLIINRDTADWIRLAKEDELARLSRQWGAA
jgi:hypothetical protein